MLCEHEVSVSSATMNFKFSLESSSWMVEVSREKQVISGCRKSIMNFLWSIRARLNWPTKSDALCLPAANL